MKTNFYLKLMTVLFLSSSLILSSCKREEEKDDDNTVVKTTPTQDKQAITTSTSQIGDDAVALIHSEGIAAIQDFTDLLEMDDAFFNKKGKQLNANLFIKIRSMFINRKNVNSVMNKTNEGNFDFDNNTGTYSWSCTKDKWDINTTSPTDKIIINFPSDSTKPCVNDAVITLNDYAETFYIDAEWGDTIYLPTLIDGNITVGGVEYVNVNATATWNKDMPITAALTLFVKPFTLTADLNNQTTTLTANVNLSRTSVGTIAAVGGTINFVDDTQEEVDNIQNAYVQFRKLKLKANLVDVAELEKLDCDSVSSTACVNSMNQYVDLEVWYASGNKIGDVEFFVDQYDELDVRIVFSDGSTELAETYLQPVFDDIQAAFDDLNNQ